MQQWPFYYLVPIFGMGVGVVAILNEFSRQRKALDVLRVYAERGEEPPEAVLRVLSRASGNASAWRPANAWASFAFFVVLSIGFGALTFWFGMGDTQRTWPFVTGFGISSFVLAALGVSELVRALTSPRANER